MVARRLPKPFTPAELRALFATSDPVAVAAMRFLHATGMRSAEALSITSTEAETWPRPGVLRRRTHATRITGKGGKERVVLLNPKALASARLALSASAANGHLFGFSDRQLRRLVARAGLEAGVERAHPHRFRHTYCSEHAEAGTDIAIVADMAGHSSVNTTRLYYESSVRARSVAERRRRRFTH